MQSTTAQASDGPVRHRGRFAPSPTGPLHFGSLTTAVGSYLAARTAGGEWHLRIDDLDRARAVPGAADAILRTLEAFGFDWDGPVWYQSQRTNAYEAAVERLRRDGFVYECSCSRRELQQLPQALANPEQDVEAVRYPGFCRSAPLAPERGTATRFRVRDEEVCFDDGIQGRIAINVQRESGDFVVRRRDGHFAYQLACAADDAAQGFSHVVRGADLLGSTARQILLQDAFGYPRLHYEHLPVIVDVSGRKLSKSSTAPAVDTAAPGHTLWQALQHLQQNPPYLLEGATVDELWRWARAHWTREPLKRRRTVQLRTEKDARKGSDVSLHGLGARERLD